MDFFLLEFSNARCRKCGSGLAACRNLTSLRLFARLEELFQAMQRSGLFESLLVDGSFVTAKPVPNDIDLEAVLKRGHDFERDLLMSEYALVFRSLLRRSFGFDVMVAESASPLYKTYVEFFSRVRKMPTRPKDCCE